MTLVRGISNGRCEILLGYLARNARNSSNPSKFLLERDLGDCGILWQSVISTFSKLKIVQHLPFL